MLDLNTSIAGVGIDRDTMRMPWMPGSTDWGEAHENGQA